MSTCVSIQSLFIAKVRIILIVAALTTGLEVSLKSRSVVCQNPFATNLALYLLIIPSGFSCTMYTDLFPISFQFWSFSIKVQVSFLSRHCIHLPWPFSILVISMLLRFTYLQASIFKKKMHINIIDLKLLIKLS